MRSGFHINLSFHKGIDFTLCYIIRKRTAFTYAKLSTREMISQTKLENGFPKG